ncbi:hypothetical protein ACWDOP_15055 [Nocardia sp. NPDC003693]
MTGDGVRPEVNLLDIDEPDEVLAAAVYATGVAGAAAAHVRTLAGALTLTAEAGSPLDDRLVELLRWFRTAVLAAAASDDRLATAGGLHAMRALRDIVAVDEDGGRAVRRRADPS